MSENLFVKVKKRLSEIKPEDIAKFAIKEAAGEIPIVGSIIKDAFDEFSPDEKRELLNELKELSEVQFKEIGEKIGASHEYLRDIQKFTLYTFEELKADHEEIKELLNHLIQTAGGSISIGDVSGQVAIGENITLIINKDGSKSWLYTNGIRPATDPANIFGRQHELEEIDRRFSQTPALAITGFRGTGKSTLASMYLDRIEKRGEYAGIYWRRVNETLEIGDVVGSFFTAIGKPIDLGRYKQDEDKLALLFRELKAAPYFLVLDNFEIILDPQTNMPLKLKQGFSNLIENAKDNAGRSQFLFTSWEYPASERGIRPEFYCIGGLDESAAIQLLRRNGLTEPDNELKMAVALSGGHPLALILLVQLVKEGAETLSSILKDDTLWKGEVTKNILDKVYKERLSEEERKLLQYVSLYREPVPLKAIIATADGQWSEALVKEIALSLNRKSLLQKTENNYWEESLIHSYAYSKLADKVERIERHKLAFQYYLYLKLPEKEKRTRKEDVQPLIEAHYHACVAKEYDKAASIIFDHELYDNLDMWGSYRTLVELYTLMLPQNHFSNETLLSEIKTHSAVLGELGLVYSDLGQVEKAIQYYEKALAIDKESRNRRGEENQLGNIGTAYSNLGQVEKAIQYYEKALAIAQEIGDRSGEGAHLGNMGSAYRALGQVEKAIQYYENALDIAVKIEDKRIEDKRNEGGWLENLGTAYSHLGQVEKAIQYYEKALDIAVEIEDKINEGRWLGNLGNAHYSLGQVDKAIQYYEKALAIAQKIEDKRNEGTWLGNLGLAYSNLGQVDKAIQYHETALACLLLARDIRTQIKDPYLEQTEANLNDLKEKLGEKEFEKLAAEVAPRAEEIVRKMLERA